MYSTRFIGLTLLYALATQIIVANKARCELPASNAGEDFFQLAKRIDGTPGSGRTPFSSDGKRFVTSHETDATIWSAETLKPIGTRLNHPHLKFTRITADGTMVLTAGAGKVCIWDVATSSLRTTATVGEDLDFIELDPRGKRFAAITKHFGSARIWVIGEPDKKFTLQCTDSLISIEFSPSHELVVTHGLGTPFQVWSAVDGTLILKSVGSANNANMPYGAQFDTEGKTLLAPIFDYGYHIIDVATGKILKEKEFEIGPKEVKDLTRVYGVGHGYGPDKYYILTEGASKHGPAIVFTMKGDSKERRIGSSVDSCQITIDGKMALLSNYTDNSNFPNTEIWDIGTNTRLHDFGVSHAPDYMSPDGSVVLTSNENGQTTVWKATPELSKKRIGK